MRTMGRALSKIRPMGKSDIRRKHIMPSKQRMPSKSRIDFGGMKRKLTPKIFRSKADSKADYVPGARGATHYEDQYYTRGGGKRKRRKTQRKPRKTRRTKRRTRKSRR